MNKICTSLEQSKKLIELGIDVNTADMVYQSVEDEYGDGEWEAIPRNNSLNIGYDDDIPCWSLSALLGILAEQHFIIKANTNWKDMIKVGNEFNIDIPIRHCKIWFPSLLDAAFEMVWWLKENGKI